MRLFGQKEKDSGYFFESSDDVDPWESPTVSFFKDKKLKKSKFKNTPSLDRENLRELSFSELDASYDRITQMRPGGAEDDLLQGRRAPSGRDLHAQGYGPGRATAGQRDTTPAGYQEQGRSQGYPDQGRASPGQGYPDQRDMLSVGYPEQGSPQGYQEQGRPQGYQDKRRSSPGQGYPEQGDLNIKINPNQRLFDIYTSDLDQEIGVDHSVYDPYLKGEEELPPFIRTRDVPPVVGGQPGSSYPQGQVPPSYQQEQALRQEQAYPREQAYPQEQA
ncbi:MAG: hypothetical protein LBQ43_01395, partial [Holosporales bacterium]|nr:hypothetical protein [Holosporales bacterium]